ncbi:hypothetical protein OIE66_12360 [Nonomuraea sp. NBC_01738]|uniref:hypothetical protein n=1 Tax=Nonomuraea sp. NBC_01738 TaxID=2976003 RepID=UPI002E129F69|nr:hypothetical protein OIE66_12360 [Nonomuraea sp. NBC_01738]
MKRSWVLKVVVVLTALLAVGAGGVAWAYPSVAATACPGCYGLSEVTDGVYAEPGLTPEQRRQVTDTAGEAVRRVTAFYGDRLSSPTMLICLTEQCYQRLGGGKEKGVAVLNRAVILSPRGVDPVIASHELSHVELHARVSADIPQWLDEGLAVVVSDDSRYLKPGPGDRCTAEPGAGLPVTLQEWLRAASADERTYARAACAAWRRLTAEGGVKALITGLDG